MKIKNLQINVLALLFGFAVICFVNKTEANNATTSPEGQQLFDQNGDGSSNKGQKSPKRGNAAAALNWTFRGPDNGSGKVTSVVSSSSTIYVGAAHNGVWKSTGGGATWDKMPVENNLNLYVTCLALDEASNVLYAGTGGDFTGQGVFKSEAGGSLKLMAGSESWTNVSKIAVFDNRVYAATNVGLMCYTGGAWQMCTGTRSGEPVTLNGPVRDMSVNKSGLVIVAMNKAECYISKTGAFDGFEFNNLTANVNIYTVDNIAVAASPADNNVLYVVGAKVSSGAVEKALLSEDQGDTWTVILSWFMGPPFIDPLEGNGININNIYADPVDPYTLYVASRNIWKGKRYSSDIYDFGLSAISSSDIAANSEYYLHSNVRAINFYESSENTRLAYIATDGGVYKSTMNIALDANIVTSNLFNKFLIMSSYHKVGFSNKGYILASTPTIGVQAIGDPLANYNIDARPIWDDSPAANAHIVEGSGGACAISLVNENYYAYALLLNKALTFRRSIDYGYSFQPLRESSVTVEWLSKDMLPNNVSKISTEAQYDAPMIMWESFTDNNTYDTVWFKADTVKNFYADDRIIYAPSKNFNYPIEYSVPYNFAHGDSIQVPDPIQNRMFIGLINKIFMTREALNYSKTPVDWFKIAELESRDTSSVFAVSDNANTLYIGTRLGNIHGATNLREVYSDSTVKLAQQNLAYSFTNKKIRAIAVDPTDENHAVVVLEGGGDNIYETTNGTSEPATFSLIKSNLPNNVYAVLFPKGAKKGTIMVGTEKGIWMKESGSTTWTANNNGLGEIPVMTLTQMTTLRPGVRNVPYYDLENGNKMKINYPNNQNTYLTIYAGTYGSGIFSTNEYVGIDEFTPDNPKESNSLTVIPNPVKDIATIELDMAKGQATIQVYSVDGRCVKEQVAKSTINTIDFKNYAPGTYIIYVIQGDVVKSAKVIKL